MPLRCRAIILVSEGARVCALRAGRCLAQDGLEKVSTYGLRVASWATEHCEKFLQRLQGAARTGRVYAVVFRDS